MFYERPSLGVESFARGDEASLSDVAKGAFDDARFQAGMWNHIAAVEQAYDDQINRVETATGVRLENPYRLKGLAPQEQIARGEAGDAWSFFDKRLDELAAQYPDKRDEIKPPRGFLAPVFDEMRRREETALSTVDRSSWTIRPRLPYFGEVPLNPAALAGGFAGQMTDPLQAFINFAVGPTAKVGVGAKSILWNAAKMGAANMAVEAAQQPLIQEWRAKAGLESGTGMALRSVAMSGLFGFALDAGVRSASRGLGITRGAEADAALDAAAHSAPESDVVRQAAAGDAQALDTVVRAAGVADEPAVRGARQAIEDEAGLVSPIEGVDDGDGLRSLIQALRNADDDGEPPAGAASRTPPARGEPIADAAPAERGRTFIKDGKPVSFQAFDPQRLAVDADTFQFRRQVNKAGTTGRLSSVKTWDPMASGKVVVFERLNGEQVIADGHHRLELANRLSDQKPELQGYLFREADGWTPEDVRAYAAKKNMIDSPRVDPVDAARVLRERPDLIDGSVPVGDETIRQARALAKLSDDGFGMVVGGVLPANYAALVGDLVPDRSRHASMMAEMAEAAPANVREARYLVGDLLQLPVREEVQFTLFGAGRIERSILKERSKVLDQALKALREDKRVFDLLDREAGRIEEAGNQLNEDANAARAADAERVSAVIEQLALNRGPVSSWLSEAALSVSQGTPATVAAKAFAHRVSEALERDGLKGLLAEPEPLRAGGFDEPAGPEARLQVEQLEGEFAEDIERALKPELYDERQAVLFALRMRGLPGKAEDQIATFTNVDQIKANPNYKAAKGGDRVAAADLVEQLVKSEDLQRARQNFGADAIYVPVIAEEAGGRNKIPEMLAHYYAAATGAKVADDITQANRVHHTGARPMERLISRAVFEGPVEAGRAYVLVDDVTMLGGTLAELANHIHENGGKVVGSITLVNAGRSDVGKFRGNAAKEIEARYGDIVRKEFGAEPAALTPGEQTYILNFRDADALRAGIAKARGERDKRLRAKEVLPPEADGEIGGGSLFALRSAPYTHTPAAAKLMPEIRAELLKTVQMLPPDVRLRVTENLVYPGGLRAAGMWDGADRIVYVALSAGDPVRTSRHEVVHALRQSGLLSDDEFDMLYAAAEKLGLRQAYFIDKFYKEAYTKAFGHRGEAYVEALLREETIANMFSDYSLNGRRFGDVAGGTGIDKIIDQIVQFLKAIRDMVGRHGFSNVNDIFQAIESGDVGRRAMFSNAITDAEREVHMRDLAEACKL